MDDIVNVTTAMYDTTVRGMFPATSYVLDTYIDRRNRVWIIDFAPWGETEGILFDWEELGQAPWMSSSGRAQFRCALRDGVRPSARMFDGLPLELRNVSAMEDLVTAARRMGDAQQTDSSSEDDTVDSDA